MSTPTIPRPAQIPTEPTPLPRHAIDAGARAMMTFALWDTSQPDDPRVFAAYARATVASVLPRLTQHSSIVELRNQDGTVTELRGVNDVWIDYQADGHRTVVNYHGPSVLPDRDALALKIARSYDPDVTPADLHADDYAAADNALSMVRGGA